MDGGRVRMGGMNEWNQGKEGGEGTGCQYWRPWAILVSRAVGVPVEGRPVLAPLDRLGARPGEPSPGDPGLGTLGKEWKGGKEGKGRKRNLTPVLLPRAILGPQDRFGASPVRPVLAP